MHQNIINKINEIININNRFDLIKEKILNNCFSEYEIKNLNDIIYIKSFKNKEIIKNREIIDNKYNITYTECSICYCINNNKLSCNHDICYSCFEKWDKQCIIDSKLTTCPICRVIIT